MSLVDQLKGANQDTLREIIREAESRLSAQLTAAIAADQRALSFAGLLAVAGVVTGSAGGSLLIGEPVNVWLGWTGIVVTIALLAAMLCAIQSAKPAKFQFPGNDPANWVEDVAAGKSLDESLVEMASFYSEMLDENRKLMETNGTWMKRAFGIASTGLLAGAAFTIVIIAGGL